MKTLLKKDKVLLMGCVFIILVIVHFPLLTKNIIGADILLNNYYYHGYSWEISLGRFGLYIVGIIKSFLSIPHLDLFISFILISISVLLIIDLFEIKKTISKVFCVLLFSLSPIVSATLLFHYCAIGYFLAFLLGILSVYVFYKLENKYLKYGTVILLVTLSLSMYQAYFSSIITFFVIYNLFCLIKNKINYVEAGKYLIAFLGGVIFYFVMVKISQTLFHIDMSSYSNANKIGLSTLLNFPSKIKDSYVLFYQFFFTNDIIKNTYLGNNIVNILLLIVMFISIIITMVHNRISKLNFVIGMMIVILLPIFLNSVIFVIPDSKLQLLMSASYLFVFLLIIILNEHKYIRYISYILLLLLFRNYLVQDQAAYMSLENSFAKYDTVIKSSILQNINNLNKKFVVIGNISDKANSDLVRIYDFNYGYICDENIFWDEYNLRKIAFERFVYEYYGLEVSFVDEKTYQYILNNRNTSDILYTVNNVNVIDFDNY